MGKARGIVKISGDFQLLEISEEEEHQERERLLGGTTGERIQDVYLADTYVNLGMVLQVIREGGGEKELADVIAGCICHCAHACLTNCKKTSQKIFPKAKN